MLFSSASDLLERIRRTRCRFSDEKNEAEALAAVAKLLDSPTGHYGQCSRAGFRPPDKPFPATRELMLESVAS